MSMGNLENDARLLELAEQIATAAHMGQADKVGQDYVEHPRRVAHNVLGVPHDPMQTSLAQLQCVAWLHDVIEDGPANGYSLDLADWRNFGFTEDTIEAVQVLTYRKPQFEPGISPIERAALKKQSKLEYYLRIATHPIARPVKLADLADNCNLQRQEALKASGAHHDPDKYPLALATIGLTRSEWEWFNETIKKQVA